MRILRTSTPKAKKRHRCDYCDLFIEIGEQYELSAIKDDDFYVWKNHILCGKVASALNMFDNCDEGLTDEYFRENIREEYMTIMSNEYAELYESKDFIVPDFAIQLQFVIDKRTVNKEI